MEAFFIDNMAPIMFGALVIFLLFGYPAAFSLGAVGLIFALIGIELGQFQPDFLQALPDRVYGVMSNDTLLAIPFFTFMGLVLERSGMAEDLLDTIGQLFGTVRGGLAYAVVFVGALLAATTGVVAASVISMGLISLPIMLRYGYDRRVASGVIAASGTLAQIIPPSLVLIVMADQLGKSVGDMYEGAFIPGLVLAVLYAFYVFLVTLIFPKATPGLPVEAVGFREASGSRGVWQLGLLAVFAGVVGYYIIEQTNVKAGADFVVLTMGVAISAAFICSVLNRYFGREKFYVTIIVTALLGGAWYVLNGSGHENWALLSITLFAGSAYALVAALIEKTTGFRFISNLAEQVIFVMVPPLALIFLVLGTIFIGVATPTEGGAMGATGALLLGAAKRRLSWDLIRQATKSTAKLSAFVVFILLGARVFLAHVLRRERPHLGREHADLAARRTSRLPGLRQFIRIRARLLPRLLRARLHRHPPARPRRRASRHRPDLVRRHSRRQHADLIHAPAVRLCPVLPAIGRSAKSLTTTASPASAQTA